MARLCHVFSKNRRRREPMPMATAPHPGAIALAIAGDAAALRLCLDRTAAPRAAGRGRSAADLSGAIKAIGTTAGRGCVTVAEAVALSQMIENFPRTIYADPGARRCRECGIVRPGKRVAARMGGHSGLRAER
jgi:hypothetical protein